MRCSFGICLCDGLGSHSWHDGSQRKESVDATSPLAVNTCQPAMPIPFDKEGKILFAICELFPVTAYVLLFHASITSPCLLPQSSPLPTFLHTTLQPIGCVIESHQVAPTSSKDLNQTPPLLVHRGKPRSGSCLCEVVPPRIQRPARSSRSCARLQVSHTRLAP